MHDTVSFTLPTLGMLYITGFFYKEAEVTEEAERGFMKKDTYNKK